MQSVAASQQHDSSGSATKYLHSLIHSFVSFYYTLRKLQPANTHTHKSNRSTCSRVSLEGAQGEKRARGHVVVAGDRDLVVWPFRRITAPGVELANRGGLNSVVFES